MNATLRAPHRPEAAEAMGKGLPLALLCHGLLVWALAVGVNWRSSDEGAVAEAELWAAVPQAAAPRGEEPPAPPPAPAPAPKPEPKLEQPSRAELQREAEIAERREREREKQRKLLEERKEREDRERKARELKQKQQREQQAKAEAEQRASKAEDARREKQRQENLRRMQGMAGASGGPGAIGSALQSAGPSAGYAGRIRARIEPFISGTPDTGKRLVTEIEVFCSPDGTITGRKILRSSGNAQFDEAVLRAIDKAERIPRDVDGRVPNRFPIEFSSGP